MKQLLFSFALILMGCTLSHSQTPYAPNERVILLNNPTQKAAYVTQAQQLLATKPTILQSKNNPTLLLIRAANVSRLDKPSASLSRLGTAFPNWIEKDRSRRPDSMYCVHCGQSALPMPLPRDSVWQFPQSRGTVVADSSTCCPKAQPQQFFRVAVISVKGAGKVTIAELLEEASRLTANPNRKVDVVRLSSIFPPQANGLLNAFGQQLTKRTKAVLRPTTPVTKR